MSFTNPGVKTFLLCICVVSFIVVAYAVPVSAGSEKPKPSVVDRCRENYSKSPASKVCVREKFEQVNERCRVTAHCPTRLGDWWPFNTRIVVVPEDASNLRNCNTKLKATAC